MHLSRRAMLGSIAAGLSTPLVAQAPGSFTHGVASGDPTQNRVILWTRYTGSGVLAWQVARDAAFRTIVRSGRVIARADQDYCCKVDADRLPPDARLYYRFIGKDGTSPVGRTRTMPRGKSDSLKLALFSCSNLAFGYFNAYRHCAGRDDIDLAVHVGDYIYEYPRGEYPSAREAQPGRTLVPDGETITLADYRLRYQSYRADPDLQALHAAMPMIAIWDDHEFANDAWRHGAQNHQSDTEGPWEMRWRAAMRAYDEWMPVRARSPVHYRSFRWGDLASLIVLDTRFVGRDQQLDYRSFLRADTADPRPEILAAAVHDYQQKLNDPRRSLMGAVQESWLNRQLQQGKSAGVRWQCLVQQILFGGFVVPPQSEALIRPELPESLKARLKLQARLSGFGLPMLPDAWGGYPAAKSRLKASIREHGTNVLMLAGDSHNGWATEVAGGDEGRPLFADIGGHSVTSPGNESFVTDPAALADQFVAANPELKWCDLSQRGYVTVALGHQAAEIEWLFMKTIRARDSSIASTRRARVKPAAGVGVSPFEWLDAQPAASADAQPSSERVTIS